MASDSDEANFTTIEQQEVEIEETTVEYSELDAEESIQMGRAGPSSMSAVPSENPVRSENLSPTSSSRTSTVSGVVRQHHIPLLMPLLTMLRYCNTIWLADIVNTSFATAGIHHSCVSEITNISYRTYK